MKKIIALMLLLVVIFSFHTSCETLSEAWEESPDTVMAAAGAIIGGTAMLFSRIFESRSTRAARTFDGIAGVGFAITGAATGQEFDGGRWVEDTDAAWERYSITFLNETEFPVFVRGPGIRREQVPPRIREWGRERGVWTYWYEPGELILPNRNRSRSTRDFQFEYNAALVQWEVIDRRTTMFFEREIWDDYFYDELPLETIDYSISYGITYIGSGGFMGRQLTSVIIPDSVTSIGDWAFFRNQLTTITIPDSVTSIGGWVFAQNPLINVIIPFATIEAADNAWGGEQWRIGIDENAIVTTPVCRVATNRT